MKNIMNYNKLCSYLINARSSIIIFKDVLTNVFILDVDMFF